MTSRTLLACVTAVLAASAVGDAAVLDSRAPRRSRTDAATPRTAPVVPAGRSAQADAPASRATPPQAAEEPTVVDLEAVLADVQQQVADALKTADIDAEIKAGLGEIDVDGIVAGALQSVEAFLPGTPRLGLGIRDLTADEAKAAGLDGIRGALVTDVHPESPAAKAGLAADDVIVRVDAEDVRSARHLSRLVAETPAGREVRVEYVRGGARATAALTPETAVAMAAPGVARPFPGTRMFSFAPGRPWGAGSPLARGRLGIGVQDLTTQLAGYFGVEGGVLVTNVADGSAAARGGLKAGDVITRIGTTDVASVGDLMRSLREVEGGTEVEVQVSRDKESRTLTVTPDATPTRERRSLRSRSRSASV